MLSVLGTEYNVYIIFCQGLSHNSIVFYIRRSRIRDSIKIGKFIFFNGVFWGLLMGCSHQCCYFGPSGLCFRTVLKGRHSKLEREYPFPCSEDLLMGCSHQCCYFGPSGLWFRTVLKGRYSSWKGKNPFPRAKQSKPTHQIILVLEITAEF